ncbi:hypothetical protein [Pseudonocardia sp. C8]|uniref:COG4315 family predicted lipoprotein n=1 Tax=Pseudonocardia sp. C8 TaxID=2762759 RepID=UPI001C92D9E8
MPTGTVVMLGPSQFGDVLFDGDGRAMYMFAPEKGAAPACYGECAAAWPPAVTDGPPQASGGTRQELLGTTLRTDGTTQLTYAGHPLYAYRGEPPGVVRCHNVDLHGGLWYALTASGEIAPLEPRS